MTLAVSATEYDARQFADNYPRGIERHFWSRARNVFIEHALRDARRRGLIGERARLLEVGCGPGIVISALRRAGHDVIGAELGCPTPLSDAAPFIATGMHAQNLDRETRNGIQALLFLDVIEHVADDAGLLREMLAAFPNCTCVIVTVPARPEVWSSHDEHYGHFRRYTSESLHRSLRAANIRPAKVRYHFPSLYAAAALMKLVGRDRDPVMRAPRHDALHGLLAAALTAEARLIGAAGLPGLSLLAIGSRIPARA